MKKTVATATPESGLALEELTMTPTRVETRLHMKEIMETSTSKPWGTYWCSKLEKGVIITLMMVSKFNTR